MKEQAKRTRCPLEGIVYRWILHEFFLSSSNRKRPRMSLSFMYNNRLDVVERIDTTYATPDRLGSLLYCNPCTWWEGQGGTVWMSATFWCRNSAVSLLFYVPDVSPGYNHACYTTTYWSISMVTSALSLLLRGHPLRLDRRFCGSLCFR